MHAIKLAVLAIAAVVVAGCNNPQSAEKRKARDKIDLCWEDYERKSFDPPTKRFIAGACETLEAEFLKKFGHRP